MTGPFSVWPHLFRGAGHEKRRGEQLEMSLAFMLYIGSFPCAQLPGPVHTTWLGRVFFVYIFSLGLCFACLFVLFDLFVSPFFCVSLGSWVISVTVFGTSITNLNEPCRALATSTILLGCCKQKQCGLRGLLCRWPSITEWEMYITAQGPHLWNDLYCVEWDVKL